MGLLLETNDKRSLRLRHLMEMSDRVRFACKTLQPESEFTAFRVDTWYTRTAGKHIYLIDIMIDWPNWAAYLSAQHVEDLVKSLLRFYTSPLEKSVEDVLYT